MDTITLTRAEYTELIAVQTDFYVLINALKMTVRNRDLISEHEARQLLEMIGETVPVEGK